MNKRSREYFFKKNEFKSWAMDWVRLAANPGGWTLLGSECIRSAGGLPREIDLTFHDNPAFKKELERYFKDRHPITCDQLDTE